MAQGSKETRLIVDRHDTSPIANPSSQQCHLRVPAFVSREISLGSTAEIDSYLDSVHFFNLGDYSNDTSED